jgi:predicted PurR-regulated permease PerM
LFSVQVQSALRALTRGGLVNRNQFLPSTLIVLLTIAVSIYLVEKLGQAVLAFSNTLVLLVLAWLLASLLRPLVNWIHTWSLPKPALAWIQQHAGDQWAQRLIHPSYGFSILVVYILLIAGLAVIVLALIPLVVEQTRQLTETVQQQASNIPGGIQRLIDIIDSTREFLKNQLRIDPALIVLPQPQELINQLTGFGTGVLQFALGLLGGVAAALGQFLLIVFLSVLVMIDGGPLLKQLLSLIPERYDEDVQAAVVTVNRSFSGFILGTVLQGLIYGLGVMALMTLFGMGSAAAAVGVATGVLLLIPLIGGPVGLLLPLLVGLLQSSSNVLWLIGALIVLQIFLFNFITPRLLSKSLHMPSLLVILSLLVGVQLIGVWGFFFAVPIAAVIYSIGIVILERAKREHDQRTGTAEQEKALD